MRAYLGHPTKTGDVVGYHAALQFFSTNLPAGFTCWECHGGYKGRIISGIVLEAFGIDPVAFESVCKAYDERFGQESHIIRGDF